MKHVIVIFFLSLVVTTFSYGQCKYLVNQKDEFTGQMEKQTDLTSIGRQSWASVGRTDSMYYILISADVGCVSPGKSKVYIKFADQSVLELTHTGKVDCKSVASFFTVINDDLETLQSKSVAKIRIAGTERYHDFDIKDPEYFKKALKCVE